MPEPTDTIHPAPPTRAPAQRADIFAPVHKAIRCGLSEMLVRLGHTSFDDDASVAAIARDLDALLAYCERHVELEERFLRPVCAGRISLHAFDVGHPAHARGIAELRALSGALVAAPGARRQAAGRMLYLHFAAFVADSLLHLGEEELVLLPLLHRVMTDDEILGAYRRMVASMTPSELAESGRRMLKAVSRDERLALVRGLQAPPSTVVELLEAARPTLPAEAFEELVAVVRAR